MSALQIHVVNRRRVSAPLRFRCLATDHDIGRRAVFRYVYVVHACERACERACAFACVHVSLCACPWVCACVYVDVVRVDGLL